MESLAAPHRVSGLSLRQAALVAGLCYLLNPVTFAEGYAMPKLVVDSAAQTMANIMGHPHLFVAAILCYFFSLVGDVVMAWALYVLLAPVNRALSLLAAALQLVYAAAGFAAVANLGAAYRLLFVSDYAGLFPAAELPAQVRLLVGSFRAGYTLGLIVFGMHLMVLGWLVARSRYMPRWLGWLLVADGAAWMVSNVGFYLLPNLSFGYLQVLFAGELVLMVWLLGWGWRLKEPALP